MADNIISNKTYDRLSDAICFTVSLQLIVLNVFMDWNFFTDKKYKCSNIMNV